MYHRQGNISWKGVNISHNIVNTISGVFFYDPFSVGSLSYCSFRKNTATFYNVIYFDFKEHHIEYINIIENSQETSERGLIFTSGTLKMRHCSIFGNTPKENKMFFAWGDTSSIKLEIKRCQGMISICGEVLIGN